MAVKKGGLNANPIYMSMIENDEGLAYVKCYTFTYSDIVNSTTLNCSLGVEAATAYKLMIIASSSLSSSDIIPLTVSVKGTSTVSYGKTFVDLKNGIGICEQDMPFTANSTLILTRESYNSTDLAKHFTTPKTSLQVVVFCKS